MYILVCGGVQAMQAWLAQACPSRWLPSIAPNVLPSPPAGLHQRTALTGPLLGQVSGSPNLVYINVSPIEYGHVLLVPKVLDDLPQLADPATMLLALRFCQAADNPYFRLAFNSLGAYATINHLHFQVRTPGTSNKHNSKLSETLRRMVSLSACPFGVMVGWAAQPNLHLRQPHSPGTVAFVSAETGCLIT